METPCEVGKIYADAVGKYAKKRELALGSRAFSRSSLSQTTTHPHIQRATTFWLVFR